ncbi:UBN2_3 domain-containing protein [Cephalotus follicularis]|uniref:UBN2_3 domain-containing protein n=1 Tax=Cephalotus follicularis TaxID=3775 RepID=A0A1Q3DEL7_CEPFO|nr:UBN2_3 domain-containing protein [Cephalotus follicularis]
MSEDTTGDIFQITVNSENRIGVSISDNPSLQISPKKLDGQKYLEWSRSCLLFIKARGLYDYLIEKKKRPVSDDPLLGQWEYENSLVMSWLINSMQAHIAHVFCFWILLIKFGVQKPRVIHRQEMLSEFMI